MIFGLVQLIDLSKYTIKNRVMKKVKNNN